MIAHTGPRRAPQAIQRRLQRSVWQRCRVHRPFAAGFGVRNLLQCVPGPGGHQGMVTAALRSVFAQESAAESLSSWDHLAASLAERFPMAAEL